MGIDAAGRADPESAEAYDDFEFHTIFHALNNFCSVDLSAVYLDILKDRLYTFRKESHDASRLADRVCSISWWP